MKRIVYPLAILSILLFACNISSTATPAVATSAPVATTAPTASETSTATEPPAATDTPTPQTNATCNEMSLHLDPALATGFTCQSVPEAGDTSAPPFAVNPQYTEITLQGYVLGNRMMTPHIDVFPVGRFGQLLPDTIPPLVTNLQSLINGTAPGTQELPLLPIQNAGQLIHVQYQVIPIANGKGTRFLSEYAQFFDPINNFDMFYTFQGLTSDGKYWISAVLPISNPLLPADGKNPPNGQSWDEFGNAFPKYIADITGQLNSQAPESYSPTIPMLDAMVATIKIQP
jgi:hypothetical protein